MDVEDDVAHEVRSAPSKAVKMRAATPRVSGPWMIRYVILLILLSGVNKRLGSGVCLNGITLTISVPKLSGSTREDRELPGKLPWSIISEYLKGGFGFRLARLWLKDIKVYGDMDWETGSLSHNGTVLSRSAGDIFTGPGWKYEKGRIIPDGHRQAKLRLTRRRRSGRKRALPNFMNRIIKENLWLPVLLGLFCGTGGAAESVVYEGKSGPGVGKHIVFLSGDEEYRSEECLPQLAKILATRHGFKCTVLFAVNPTDGTIDPNFNRNLPGAEALDSADAIVMSLRFREWPDAQMKHFVDAYLAGKPMIALRTSTHAFNYPKNSTSPYAKFSFNSSVWPGGFGKQVLGETWVAHHGEHRKEATRGVIEATAVADPILRGVTDLFGDTDVYTANPTKDAKILVRGEVLTGMKPTDPPVQGKKNEPMQPVVWTRLYANENGKTNKILCTTMGAATDLQNEGLRRLLVNGVYWGVGLEVPEKADVNYVGPYKPTMYGFNGFIKGTKPDTYAPAGEGR